MNNRSRGGEIRNEGAAWRPQEGEKGMTALIGLKGLSNTRSLTPNPHNLRVCYLSLKLSECHFLICTTEITLPLLGTT